MSLRAIEFHIAETTLNIRRNGLASFAAVTNCTLSLFVLGVFVLGGWNVNAKTIEIASSIRIVVYMRRDADVQTTQRLANELQVLYAERIRATEVVSAEEAFERFKKAHPDLAGELEARPNPLGPQVEIQLRDPGDYASIVERAKQNPSVDEVGYGQKVFQALASVKRLGQWIILSMLAVLTIASMLTISNTIRLTIHARRKEIGIMQMVGATARFIKTPFVLEGVFDGVVGAVLGSTLLLPAYMQIVQLLESAIPALAPTVTSPAQLAAVGGALVVAGGLFGFLGSYIAVQRYLSI